MEKAEALSGITASAVMPELTTPWSGFGELLDRVRTGSDTGHPGWDAMAGVMRSYRLRKSGARDQAQNVAEGVAAPLGESLIAWYAELTRRAGDSLSQPAIAEAV
jgi:thymidylate synthase